MSPKNRVAYIVGSYPSITQTFIMRELLELERNGFHLNVFSLQRPNHRIEHPEASALRASIIYIPRPKEVLLLLLLAHIYCLVLKPLRYLKTISYVVSKNNANFWEAFLRAGFVVSKLQHTGIRHLHAHFAANQTLVAMLASSLTGLPYSFTAHAYDIFIEQQGLTEKIRSAKFVVAISDFNKKYLTPYCTDEEALSKIHVVHCSVDLDQFALTRARRRQRSLRSESFTILTVAHLGEKKGHIYLLQALSLLREKGRIFHWIVAGDGPQRSLLEEEVRTRGLTGQVTFAGEVTSDKVLELLERADVFVLPCVRAENGDMDGIPVALMEAMAAGVPVVSTTISGIPELIDHGKNGLLVKSKDVRGLAEVLEHLFEHSEESRKLGKAAPDKVAQHFEVKTSVRKLIALFHT
jgi:glycosyltransferase involved in cell wall biosynthesis